MIESNVDKFDCVTMDPRMASQDFMIRSANFLLKHPIEAAERAIPNLPTHQPLASLLHHLPTPTSDMNDEGSGDWFITPRHMRIYVDTYLVEAIRVAEATGASSLSKSCWKSYFGKAIKRGGRVDNCVVTSKHDTNPNQESLSIIGRIIDDVEAHDVIKRAKLIVAFHPDSATEPCIDLAILLKIPFVVCPCCLYSSSFPDRFLPPGDENGHGGSPDDFGMKKVRQYEDFLDYLQSKHPKIKRDKLKYASKQDTARNIVLYTLPGDYD
mmetsp:Transcript_37946/g.44185  ORF Transcript_37946/g.44185 Transcript_37946/m.44185 type:complete len:268 (+) Transcript_37946:72-875(+)